MRFDTEGILNSRKRAEVALDIGQPIKIMVLPVRIPQGPLILTMEKRVTNKLSLKNQFQILHFFLL